MAASDQQPEARLPVSPTGVGIMLLDPCYDFADKLNRAWYKLGSWDIGYIQALLDQTVLDAVILPRSRSQTTDGRTWHTIIKVCYLEFTLYIAFPMFTSEKGRVELARSSAIYLNPDHEPPPSLLTRVITTFLLALTSKESYQ